MIEKRIGFNVAKLAREKGFKEIGNCYFGYTEDGKNSCNVMSSKFSLTKYPILDCNQTLLQKWIREVHGIFVIVVTIKSLIRTIKPFLLGYLPVPPKVSLILIISSLRISFSISSRL